MSPFLFTCLFLVLIGAMTTSEFQGVQKDLWLQSVIQRRITQEQHLNCLVAQARFEDLHDERAATPLRMRRPKAPSPTLTPAKSTSLNYNTARPPNNSRLNFYLLIQEEDSFLYDVTVRLLRNLYHESPGFVPGMEIQLIEALRRQKNEMTAFVSPDELATVYLGNENLQNWWYTLLRGEGVPSLLYYITYDSAGTANQKKINLLFASQEIRSAIFHDAILEEKLEHILTELWRTILNEENLPQTERMTRTKIRQTLQQQVVDLMEQSHIPSEVRKKIDYTLGKSGDILFVQDPLTGRWERRKK